MKNLLIAEDHPLILMGIQQSLQEMMAEVKIFKADNFERVLKLLEIQPFDLVILDINMPGGDKVGMVGSIRLKQSAVPILINSSYDEQLYALPFLKAGANGFVSKLAPTEEFKKAVETVMQGKIYASPSVLINAFGILFQSKSGNEPVNALSDKELEIAKLLLKGFSTKGIGKAVNLSSPSVSNYKTKIFEKLRVTNIIELTRYFELNDIRI